MTFPITLGLLSSLLTLHNLASLPLGPNTIAPWVFMCLGIALGLGAKAVQRYALLATIGYTIAGAAFGVGYGHWRAETRLADQLPAAWESRDVVLEGYITDLPQRLSDTPRPATRFSFVVSKTLTTGAVVPQQLRLVWYGEIPPQPTHVPESDAETEEERSPAENLLKPGQRWRLTVRLKRPHGNANPGGFDYEGWLFAHTIRATGYVRGPTTEESPRYLGQHPWRFSLWVERIRERIREQFLATLPAERYPHAGILIGLAIGDQGAISPSEWQLFNRTGLTHLMVVSGSHITLFAALVAWLAFQFWARTPQLALVWPAQRFAALAGWGTAFFYANLSGLGIPALRTLCMLSVVAVALFQHRHIRPSQTLVFSLLAVLVLDPWAVLSPGFWLSFATVGALLSFSTPKIPGLPPFLRRVNEGLRSQWAASLATIPLLLMFFQELPLISPVANAIAIPLIGLVVTPLALLGTVLFAMPGAGEHLAFWVLALANGMLTALLDALPLLSHWPTWQAAHAPFWATGLASLGIALLLLPQGIPGRLSLGILSLLPALFWPASRPTEGTFWADIIDVGQGQAVLVRTENHALLYDSGPRYGTWATQTTSQTDAGQRVILPFLRAEGVRLLDVLMVSHKDSDHAGGTETLKQNLAINKIMSPKVSVGDTSCHQGQHWEWSGVKFDVLHPPAEMLEKPPRNTNAVSCVLRVSSPTQSLLLTGDLPEKEELILVQANAELRADSLLAPHHGSRTSSSNPFLQAIKPKEVIISAGYRNRFGHPHHTVIERYASLELRVWRTDQQGAIQIRPNKPTTGWRTLHRRYWQDSPPTQ